MPCLLLLPFSPATSLSRAHSTSGLLHQRDVLTHASTHVSVSNAVPRSTEQGMTAPNCCLTAQFVHTCDVASQSYRQPSTLSPCGRSAGILSTSRLPSAKPPFWIRMSGIHAPRARTAVEPRQMHRAHCRIPEGTPGRQPRWQRARRVIL